MNATCADLETALRGDDPSLAEAFARHTLECPACREELAVWNAISTAAPSLRKEWPSPGLEARIRSRASPEAGEGPPRSRAMVSLAGWAVLLVALAGRAFLSHSMAPAGEANAGIDEAQERLLTERALSEVEQAEQVYARSIDALSKLAEPRLRQGGSSLLANYREKLLLLDTAIADCRAQAERNRFNAHLRLELLSIYQEKQRTLESLMKEDIHAL